MEVERAAEVDRERQPLRKVRCVAGDVHRPALGLDGQVEPGRRGDLTRPDACGEDDAVRFDPLAPCLDAGNAAAVDDDPLHRARLLDPRPEPDRPSRATLDNEVGCDDACQRIEDGSAEILDRELGTISRASSGVITRVSIPALVWCTRSASKRSTSPRLSRRKR